MKWGKKASILSQKLLDCYIDLLTSKSWSEGFCVGWYFIYQDSWVKGVSFLYISDNFAEGKWQTASHVPKGMHLQRNSNNAEERRGSKCANCECTLIRKSPWNFG